MCYVINWESRSSQNCVYEAELYKIVQCLTTRRLIYCYKLCVFLYEGVCTCSCIKYEMFVGL